MFASPPTQRPTTTESQEWDVFLPDSAAAGDGTARGALAEEQARVRWREFIDPEVDQLEALPPEAWPMRILSSPMFTQWRASGWMEVSRAFDEWLPEALPWAGETPVVLTASAAQSVETTWAAFCQGWRHFLLTAEDAVLWSPQEMLALRFLPTGMVYLGGRA